jgi:hypothetical protein
MPGGDGTGPQGMGSMTGRAAGFCAGSNVPGYMNPYGKRFSGAGGRFSKGAGRGGRGRRNWYFATGAPGWSRYNMSFPAWGGFIDNPYHSRPEDEIEVLKDQADMLEQQLNEIQERMEELKKSPEKKEK